MTTDPIRAALERLVQLNDGCTTYHWHAATTAARAALAAAPDAITEDSSAVAPPAPLEGEVGELVAALEADAECAEVEHYDLCNMTADQMRRAAELLQQLPAAAPAVVPIPVSERLPGQGDCDAEGRCWWWRTDDADEWWELLCIRDAREYNAGCGNARYTHWLPVHAIPLPAPQGGEVEG